ncbi:MAG: hypothetical protein ACYTEX_09260 [Planctomycetota bacterium]|jgi:hypothetical protein
MKMKLHFGYQENEPKRTQTHPTRFTDFQLRISSFPQGCFLSKMLSTKTAQTKTQAIPYDRFHPNLNISKWAHRTAQNPPDATKTHIYQEKGGKSNSL